LKSRAPPSPKDADEDFGRRCIRVEIFRNEMARIRGTDAGPGVCTKAFPQPMPGPLAGIPASAIHTASEDGIRVISLRKAPSAKGKSTST